MMMMYSPTYTSRSFNIQIRYLSVSIPVFGGKASKRRKQNMRAQMPHLPVKSNTALPTSLAINHFDQFYGSIYKEARWGSMRLGLLSKQKYAVLVNNFGDSEATINMLEEMGCVDINQEFHKASKAQEQYVRDIETELNKKSEEPVPPDTSQPSLDTTLQTSHELSTSSLSPSEAEKRLIMPHDNVVGGGSMALHQYMPTKELKGMEEFVEEAQYYQNYKKVASRAITIKPFLRLHFPSHLRCFTFPRGDLSNFPSPVPGSLGTLNYYCMDAASLLPVLALDLRPGQTVLDMCAGPGGKSLAMIQTMYPESITCNDNNYDRVRRILSVLDQYVGRGEGVGGVRNSVKVTRSDGSLIKEYDTYDRVLVDAPCFTDRHAVTSEEGNIFVKKEIKNRLKMPEKQAELLKAGLLQLAPGGSLVYSTCTLSPMQNDGVVHNVLGQIWEETNLNFQVADLDMAVKPFRFLCKMYGRKEGLKYGQMVVPFLPNNFGPMYFCKIVRV